MWFMYALITLLFWSFADLFYKKGADNSYSHLKTGIMVGMVMGIYATLFLVIRGINFNILDIIKYLPISLFYIASMIIGYKGLKYLELSISSPLQNSSGVITSLLLFIIFRETLELIDIIGITIISIGILILSFSEKRTVKLKRIVNVLLFPFLYCVLDGLGTFMDSIYLDKLGLISEDAALVAYEYTFFIYGIIMFIYLKVFKKQSINIIKNKDKLIAAIFETLGQFFYVFAISANSTLACPIVASYSIVSVLLSRIFLKEKLSKKEYISIFIVLLGIVILGFSE